MPASRRREWRGCRVFWTRAIQCPHACRQFPRGGTSRNHGIPPPPRREGLCDFECADFPGGVVRCGGGVAGAAQRGSRCSDHPGCGSGGNRAADVSRIEGACLHADDDHLARGREVRSGTGREAGGAGSRIVAARTGEISARVAAGDFRPWRVVRGLFGPMPHQRGARQTQCQSGRMRTGVPDAVSTDRRWRAARSGRQAVFALSTRSRGGE